jgi:hypothetical protein
VTRLHREYSQSTADSLRWTLTLEEVATQCNKINLRKAYGSDNIHPAFVRHGGDALHSALFHLFVYSYTHSTIPLQWTESLVVPIYKKEGDTAKAESYRPISLTSCVMRTMEHLIQDKLIHHISPQLHDGQYGFRPQHSTYNAIYELTQCIHTQAKRSKTAIPVAFLDLIKAFDRVWHDGLLSLLPEHNVTGLIWLWIKAFLSNRRMCVINKDNMSKWFRTIFGVPQGSVLAPTLFTIFINKAARTLTANPLTNGGSTRLTSIRRRLCVPSARSPQGLGTPLPYWSRYSLQLVADVLPAVLPW